MAREMTDDERRAFLSQGTRTGKLAVADATGAPHVVPEEVLVRLMPTRVIAQVGISD